LTAIAFRAVNKAYGAHAPVLRNVDLEIDASEFCVFIGPSGCGKSTLLRMIAGLEDISSGDLLIDGTRMNHVAPAERGIAMVFQSYALFPHMTVAENMGFGLELAKRPKTEIDAKVREAARILQLEHLLDRKPKALSGGQRQRVAIGRAIVRSPKVFLFDEPLSNLDTALRAQTRLEIARLHKSFAKASMVYVTHDQVEAMTLADKIVLLHTGRDVAEKGSLAQVGSPLALFHTPRNLFVAGFIGSPKMNFLAGTVQQASRESVEVKLSFGPTLRAAVDGTQLAAGAPVTLGIRPEHVTAPAAADQTLGGAVSLVERLGTASYLYLSIADGCDDFCAATPGDSAVRSGERVTLGLPSTALHLFDANGNAAPRNVSLQLH
jgi:multiple sugar transport system ATP-binding protein